MMDRGLICCLVILTSYCNSVMCEANRDFSSRKPRMIQEVAIEAAFLLVEFLVETYKDSADYKKLEQLVELQIANIESSNIIGTLIQDIHSHIMRRNECSDLTRSFSELTRLFDKIDLAYEVYKNYKKLKTTVKNKSLRYFVQTSRNMYSGPLDTLNSIYALVVPKNSSDDAASTEFHNDATVLSLLAQNLKGFNDICDKHKSQQQILGSLFFSIITAEAKVLSILEFCYQKLSEANEVDYKIEMKTLAGLLQSRMINTIQKFHGYMKKASREVWRCDPPTNIRDVTYTELEGVFQKYLVSVDQLSWENNCLKSCADYEITYAGVCDKAYDVETNICTQQKKCSGLLYDCQDYFPNVDDLQICPANQESSRYRYEFIRSESDQLKFYGPRENKNYCSRTLSTHSRPRGKNLYDFHRRCEMCVCTCSEKDSLFISTKASTADKNYVITGARFVKTNNILHLQIQQGRISQNGYVESETVHWKDVTSVEHKHKLQLYWRFLRDLYLGIDEVSKGHVLVGLKVDIIKNGNISMLAIKTMSTFYNYENGTLNATNLGDSKTNDEDFNPLLEFEKQTIPEDNEVSVEELDIQTNSPYPSLPQPDYKMSVKFTTSSFKKDMGQSTIPFLDIQDVITRPAIPLSGIGFYLKNTEGHGGFIGLKLLTYDLSIIVQGNYLTRN